MSRYTVSTEGGGGEGKGMGACGREVSTYPHISICIHIYISIHIFIHAC